MTNAATKQVRDQNMVVLGVYLSPAAVDNAMNRFGSAGFQDSEISVLVPDEAGARKIESVKDRAAGTVGDQVQNLTMTETSDISSGRTAEVAPKNTRVTQAAGVGAGVGAAFGGTLGWFAALTGLVIPGIGALLVAGPLIGILAGGAAGGAVGALVGLGIPEAEAKLYEDRLRQGGILVSVHTDSSSRAEQARGIFRQTAASDIATTPEK
jgi:hypothetical protein